MKNKIQSFLIVNEVSTYVVSLWFLNIKYCFIDAKLFLAIESFSSPTVFLKESIKFDSWQSEVLTENNKIKKNEVLLNFGKNNLKSNICE